MRANVVSQRSLGDGAFARSTSVSEFSLASSTWSWYNEKVGVWGSNAFSASSLLEQINTTKDTSDFLWYTTSINVNDNSNHLQAKEAVLVIESLGHAALVFVNKILVGFGYGNHDDASFEFSQKINLNHGNNTLDVLSMVVGVQNYGAWFDIQGVGIFSVILGDLKNANQTLSSTEWTYQPKGPPKEKLIGLQRLGWRKWAKVGLEGECLGLDNMSLANSSLWTQGNAVPINQSLTWYKATFQAPEGKGPLSLNLASMGKGQAWVNGQSIGRYWPAYLSPSTGCTDKCDYRGTYDASKCQKKCGQPAQTLYHIPRTWVLSGENLLVLHEELGGDPSKISILTKTGQEICAHVSEADPPPCDSWRPQLGFMSQSPEVRLACEQEWHITSIHFASFGTPKGNCGTLSPGSCHTNVLSIVQQACIGKQGCSIPVSTANLGDPCPGVLKSLAIQALCSG
ncbi:unnamed protein product [Ilex paraguariensis]|uniref:SUEL-type lectin domain-containing protein n=1 Tax=Ilex paraguariensis TaxID=185542 RepID=A0ABC8SK17_9AQUA